MGLRWGRVLPLSVRLLGRHQDPEDRVDDDLAAGDDDQGDDEQDPHHRRGDPEPAGEPGADTTQDAALAGPDEPLTAKRFHSCGPPWWGASASTLGAFPQIGIGYRPGTGGRRVRV